MSDPLDHLRAALVYLRLYAETERSEQRLCHLRVLISETENVLVAASVRKKKKKKAHRGKRGKGSAARHARQRARQQNFIPGRPTMPSGVDRDGQIPFALSDPRHRAVPHPDPRGETFLMPPIEPDDEGGAPNAQKETGSA